MFKKTLFAAAAVTLAVTAAPAMAVEVPTTAPAQPAFAVHSDVNASYDRDRRWRDDRGRYDRNGRYREPRRISRNSRMWRGDDGRYYCQRDNGTTGLVIGAGVGALAGHEIAGRGDRTLGAILGGAVGALVGREIDRGSLKCR